MKHVLFITSFTPSKFSAGQNFTMNLLEDLSGKNTVDVVYFQYGNQVYTPPSGHIRVIKRVPATAVRKAVNFLLCPFIHPLFSGRFSLSTLFFLRSQVKKEPYDAVVFDFSQSFLYSLFFKSHRRVLIAHDVIYQKFMRQGSRLERYWIFRIERLLFGQKGIQVYTFSDKDRTLLSSHFHCNSNVIDFYLSPDVLKSTPRLSGDNYFCFFAAWNRPENYEGLRWFIENVVPHTGTARFVVVGASMPESLIGLLKQAGTIEYIGFVEDPYEVIAGAGALIAPLFKGAGVKVKVIESLACGTPVLGTEVALEGVPEIDSTSLMECNSAEEFIEAIRNFRFDLTRKTSLKESFLTFYNRHAKRIVL